MADYSITTSSLDLLMVASVHEALRKRCLDFFPQPETRRAVSSSALLKTTPSACGVLLSIGILPGGRQLQHQEPGFAGPIQYIRIAA